MKLAMPAVMVTFVALSLSGSSFADDTGQRMPLEKAAPTPQSSVPAPSEQHGALALGESAPLTDVKMKNVDGHEFSIADVAGKKGTLVVFTCNACPYAQAWETRIVAIGNTWPKRGVGVIAINSNDPSRVAADDYAPMQERAKQRGMKYPYVVDATSELARAFGASHTPEAFLFDADGKLVYHGAVDNDTKPEKVTERYLETALKSLTGGKTIALQETKSIGCSIKFRPKV